MKKIGLMIAVLVLLQLAIVPAALASGPYEGGGGYYQQRYGNPYQRGYGYQSHGYNYYRGYNYNYYPGHSYYYSGYRPYSQSYNRCCCQPYGGRQRYTHYYQQPGYGNYGYSY